MAGRHVAYAPHETANALTDPTFESESGKHLQQTPMN